ncbi:MAG: hypothetical protein ABI597_09655 [Gammaproteobacteria bacterium]
MPTHSTFTDLTHLGLIQISGAAAKTFLQGQLTCNLDEISSAQSRLGAHCNPQGRVISLFHLFFWQQNYYLQLPRELIPIAIKALQKYAVFFKVSLSDVSDELQQVGYQGTELTSSPKETDEQITTPEFVIIKPLGEPTRYQIIGHKTAIASLNLSAEPGTIQQWKRLDIKNKLPAIYPETTEKFLPHEINLPELNAVSFQKGCYTGQEIIARMQYRGKLKSRLYQAHVKTPMAIIRGNDIYFEGERSGSIVDYAQIDYNVYELLIIAKDSDIQAAALSIDPEKKYILELS